jgi:rhodanese-related sulfurtransferase
MAVVGLSPAELRARIDRGERLALLDVREDDEFERVHLPGSRHVPLAALASRLRELDLDEPVVCICHHGIRSSLAAALLDQREFAEVYNLLGGLDRWALEVDPAMPRY